MLKDQDFANMFFKIDSAKSLEKVSNMHLCPSLLNIQENQARYLIYLYDKDSPFIKYHRNKSKREEAIRDYVKLPKTKFQVIRDMKEDWVVECIIEILSAQKDMIWSMIAANEYMFYENLRHMLSPVEMEKDKDLLDTLKKKGDIAKIQEDTSKRLDALWSTYTGGDDKLKNRIAASVQYTPENIANVS